MNPRRRRHQRITRRLRRILARDRMLMNLLKRYYYEYPGLP